MLTNLTIYKVQYIFTDKSVSLYVSTTYRLYTGFIIMSVHASVSLSFSCIDKNNKDAL